MKTSKKDVFQLMTQEEEHFVKTREENDFLSVGLMITSIGCDTFYKTYYLYKNVSLNELTDKNIETLDIHNNKYIHFNETFLDKYEKYRCGKEAYNFCKYKLHKIHKNSIFSN